MVPINIDFKEELCIASNILEAIQDEASGG